MPEQEIAKQDYEVLDEEIAKRVFGLEYRDGFTDPTSGLIKEFAGWYLEKEKIFPIGHLPKYTQDLGWAIKAAQKVALREECYFTLLFDYGKETYLIEFYMMGMLHNPIARAVEKIETLSLGICKLALSLSCLDG